MKPFSAFYDHLMPELPGITTAMVDLHLLHTARDFCQRTSAWRYDFTQAAVASQAAYDISEPELQSEIVRVTRLAVLGTLLFDDRWVPDAPGDVPRYDRADPPFTVDDDNTTITLITDEVPAASSSTGLAVTAALKPKFTAARLPDFLLNERLEAIKAGTLYRLKVMGKKPWSDRDMAQVHATDYARHCNLAATHAQQGNTRARLRVRKWG